MLGLASSSMLVTVESADDGGIRHSWIQNLAMHGDPHVAVHVAGDVASSIAKLSEPRLVDVLSSEFSEAMEEARQGTPGEVGEAQTNGDDRRVDMNWIEVPRSEARCIARGGEGARGGRVRIALRCATRVGRGRSSLRARQRLGSVVSAIGRH